MNFPRQHSSSSSSTGTQTQEQTADNRKNFLWINNMFRRIGEEGKKGGVFIGHHLTSIWERLPVCFKFDINFR
jgi:hypothetical protein